MEATESPLDVLSRAATMVQDSSPPDFDDSRSCPTKDLPSARWRRERRCRDRLGDYGTYTTRGQAKAQEDRSPRTVPTTNTPPPTPEVLGARTGILLGDTPLDMSTRSRPGRGLPPSYSQSISVPGYRLPARPSVITCAPPAPVPAKSDNRQGHRRELLSGMCDPVIDEHFRRSLGKDYMSLFASDTHTNGNNVSNNNNEETDNGNSSITVTGLSVDDHFAKALGETWVKLQGQTATDTGAATASTKEKKASLLQQRRGLVSI